MRSRAFLATIAVVATLLAAGCAGAGGSASAPGVDVFAGAPVPHAALAIAARLDGGSGGLPGVEGLGVDEAQQRLGLVGVRARVVAFGEGDAVSAQYPEPGAALPADGIVTLWVGEPPAPPPPPEPAPAPAPVAVTAQALPEPPAGTSLTDSPVTTAAPSAPPRRSPRTLPATAAGAVLTGAASWYGPGFAGRTTACGDVFDPRQLTMASRELRCGTRVLVTGPSGASVEATVTDWGPAEWTDRRFDLSAATFAAIHHPGAGVVNVTVEVLDS